MKYIFSAIIILTLTLIAASYFIAKNYLSPKVSVLYHYKDKSAVDPADELYVIFNPFRDIAPEQKAEEFLNNLKAGKCDALNSESEIISRNCDEENHLRPNLWELVDREDKTAKVILHYTIFRDRSRGYSNTWLTLKKDVNGWKVANNDSAY